VTAAAALFAFIFLFNHFRPHPQTGPTYLLPGFDAKAIKSVQIQPAGQLEIRASRSNGVWRLTEPVAYPAQGTNIEKLLNALQQITIAHKLSEQELRSDPKADEDYGIDPAQISMVLTGDRSTNWIHFGHKTSPGDQVFVRVIGIAGVSIVDADVLDFFPPNANAWRDTTLADFTNLSFDRISVTNSARSQSFLLQRDSTNRLWAMIFPLKARADSEKVEDAMAKLETMRVQQFVSDDPKVDLESFGLQPPALTVAFGNGTNFSVALDFGKESTNSPGLIYARRHDQNAIVTVPTNTLGEWSASYDVFRDRHLVSLLGPVDKIEVHGQDNFYLQWQTNNTWRVMPNDFPADQILATGLARTLSDMQVTEFVKDSVPEPDLPHYGLAPAPMRKYTITWTTSPTATNPPTELDFGTNSSGQIFARRIGEDAVYGISPADFQALPSASWELRDRSIWNFDVTNVAQIVIQQEGRKREITRTENGGWSLAKGSSGIINASAIEDTTRELGHLAAFAWAGHGAEKLAGFGFSPQGYQISIELKSGEKLNMQFGGTSRLGSPYASVLLNGEPWIFEFPPDLYSAIQYCLTIPAAH
jgi:hypothetical protein